MTDELGKTEGLSTNDIELLHRRLALGAIKYFLVKVEPTKRMLFDPAESVDLRGHTGPFIQYSHARIFSIERKAAMLDISATPTANSLHATERVLLRSLLRYRDVLADAARNYNPALIANYAFELAKDFNRFYDVCKVIDPTQPETSAFRLNLSIFVRRTLAAALAVLGIEAPERM
jgi:arginyl-tRNA synthetase